MRGDMSNKFAAQCSVLLVDDSPDLLPMLEHLLTAEGYRVQTAASRDQALELLQEERFHVAVIDARLDDRDPYNYDGFRLVRDVRSLDPSTAVILLTIAADLDIAREALYSVSGEFHPAFETSRTVASAFLEKDFPGRCAGCPPVSSGSLRTWYRSTGRFRSSIWSSSWC